MNEVLNGMKVCGIVIGQGHTQVNEVLNGRKVCGIVLHVGQGHINQSDERSP